ncbi:MAG: phenylalanine 4-monooxygenase, partial [Proteobacteria bacterium]
MAQTLAAPGLTTGHAPFIEEARNRGDLYITQDYS